MNTGNLIETLADFLGSNNWLLLAFSIVLGSLIIDFVQRKILARLERRVSETENLWDDAVYHALVKPISLLIWVFGITLAAEVVFRQGTQDRSMLEYVTKAWQIGLIVSATWFLLRLARGVEANFLEMSRRREDVPDETTVDALSKLVRISLLITSALVILQELGVSISGVLAFGGIGGLAVGLAAKDLLANFFGGLTVYLDRPFKVGDWIRSPDRTIEGTVENIGWRQTTIRKFDKRPIYVPNATFTTIAVENPSRMTHRRIYETIGVRYEDATRVGKIVESVKDMLQNHEEIDQTQTMIVNFDAFAPSSMDFFVYTFTRTTNWVKYHEVKQDVLLRIEQIIREHGAEIAFPTSSLHVESVPPQFAGLVDDSEEAETNRSSADAPATS
ncbi:MAG: mechanosensitive ion channel family protein [Xanthomonadales bacterium]|nr:mechanosensitive ion channel family protein [Xanthomonadales bacterium]